VAAQLRLSYNSSVNDNNGKQSAGRVAIIGLDGGTFNLLDPFMANGVMPRLKGICENGRRGILKSTRPPITACAWPSLYSGCEPGRHSIFDFRRPLRNADLKRRFINSSSIRLPKVWEVAAEEGASSILLNLPLTYPPFEMRGKLISGMPIPAAAKEITYPNGLIDEIERECGGYIADIDFLRGRIPDVTDDAAVGELLEQVHRALELRLNAALHLMATKDWRLFFSCFITPDRLQHLYYSLLDEKCLEGKKLNGSEEKLREKLVSLYGELDTAIGKIADTLNDDDQLVFVSDHGFGPLKRIFHLNTWLKESGYLALKAGEGRRSIGRFLPSVVKKPLKKLLGCKDVAPDDYNALAMLDWEATRAYSGSSTEQGIYLNVKGREPYGVVEQGMEYIKLRDELIRELTDVVDPATGEKVFEVVASRDEIRTGRYIEDAPDIFIQPTRHETVMAEEFVDALSIPWHHPFGGFHREEGIFIASGSAVGNGDDLPPMDITQVMPAILTMLWMPVPEWVGSNPPDGLFTREFIERNPVRRKEYAELLAKYEDDAEDIDDAGGEDLLKGLGYIN
jgi:predicted AlkP superfamily phosphohydrolase/phosphomutase